MTETGAAGRVYRIRVCDLVLMASVGIYPHELHAPQRVRFNVTLQVEEHAGPLDDNIGNVLSYADVVAGIRRLISHGHVNLVETLAEEVADMCLEDPRVAQATIAVDKLDIEPDAHSVGVEITRLRGAATATNARRQAAGPIEPWVVALDGALIDAAQLKPWLDALIGARLPMILVPGAGRFGEAIEPLRQHWNFSDHAALEMRLAAMEQFGRMLAAIDWRLRLCGDLLEFGRAFDEQRVAVWLPLAMTQGRSQVEAEVSRSADTLATWMAGQMGAQGVILVKPDQPARKTISLAELAQGGLVDDGMGVVLRQGDVRAWCVGMDEHLSCARALTHGGPPGTRIEI